MENGYARPVEGIHVLVDMQKMMVIEFEDRKLIPLPPPDPLRNYTAGETHGKMNLMLERMVWVKMLIL